MLQITEQEESLIVSEAKVGQEKPDRLSTKYILGARLVFVVLEQSL